MTGFPRIKIQCIHLLKLFCMYCTYLHSLLMFYNFFFDTQKNGKYIQRENMRLKLISMIKYNGNWGYCGLLLTNRRQLFCGGVVDLIICCTGSEKLYLTFQYNEFFEKIFISLRKDTIDCLLVNALYTIRQQNVLPKASFFYFIFSSIKMIPFY